MGIIEFFNNLTILESFLFGAALLIVNAGAALGTLYLTKRRHKKEGSVEKTLYYQSLLFKFILLPLLVVSTITGVFVIMPQLEAFGDYDFLVFFPILMLFALIIGLMYVFTFQKFTRELRNTSVTVKSETKEYIRVFIIVLLPFMIVMALSVLMKNWISRLDLPFGDLLSLLPFCLIPLVSVFTSRFIVKAKPIEEGELKEKLQGYLSSNGITNTKLYLWETRDKKIANAMVTGIMKKKIYVTDYMIENLGIDEIVSVLAHEMWHIKKKHVLKRVLMFFPMIIWILGCGYIFEWIEDTHNMDINIFLGLGIMFIPVIVFALFGVRYLYRKQEAQADRLVVENGINPEVFSKALLKLARLNNTVIKFNKLDEKFQTHPSFVKRIKRIMEPCNEEDIERIMNEI